MISRLSTLLNEGGTKDKIETCEDIIAEEIIEYTKEDSFYELPTNEILKIIGKSCIENAEIIFNIIIKMRENKGEESTLLLNVIKKEEATLEECINILSKFEHCPLCRRMNELCQENRKLPELDYEHEICDLKKEINKIKNKEEEKGNKTRFP